MTDDDEGLLGGLPRSRPGTRSAKRGQGAGDRPVARRSGSPRAPARDADPVGDAVRTAARSAEAGLKVAQAVTREVLRRLPRV